MPSKCVNSHAQGLAVDTRVYSSVSFWKRTVNSTIIIHISIRAPNTLSGVSSTFEVSTSMTGLSMSSLKTQAKMHFM